MRLSDARGAAWRGEAWVPLPYCTRNNPPAGPSGITPWVTYVLSGLVTWR